jgi:hypothetical protein
MATTATVIYEGAKSRSLPAGAAVLTGRIQDPGHSPRAANKVEGRRGYSAT